MKRICNVFGVLSVALCLAGCGSSTQQDSTRNQKTPAQIEADIKGVQSDPKMSDAQKQNVIKQMRDNAKPPQ